MSKPPPHVAEAVELLGAVEVDGCCTVIDMMVPDNCPTCNLYATAPRLLRAFLAERESTHAVLVEARDALRGVQCDRDQNITGNPYADGIEALKRERDDAWALAQGQSASRWECQRQFNEAIAQRDAALETLSKTGATVADLDARLSSALARAAEAEELGRRAKDSEVTSERKRQITESKLAAAEARVAELEAAYDTCFRERANAERALHGFAIQRDLGAAAATAAIVAWMQTDEAAWGCARAGTKNAFKALATSIESGAHLAQRRSDVPLCSCVGTNGLHNTSDTNSPDPRHWRGRCSGCGGYVEASNCPRVPIAQRTGVDTYIEKRMQDPEFAEEYAKEQDALNAQRRPERHEPHCLQRLGGLDSSDQRCTCERPTEEAP